MISISYRNANINDMEFFAEAIIVQKKMEQKYLVILQFSNRRKISKKIYH